MSRSGYRAFGVVALALMWLGTALAMYRHHVNALWHLVHRHCEVNARSGIPAPCRALDLSQGYALLQDKRGQAHAWLVPTRRITGAASPALQSNETPNYFWLAWRARGVLSDLLGAPVPDTAVAIVVDAQTVHSQNQLHLRIACLRADIREQLAVAGTHWDAHWNGYWLKGRRYYLRTLSEAELAQRSPFLRVTEELRGAGGNLGRYGLALTMLQDGRFVLLALPRTLLGRGANLGAAHVLQDDDCATAGTRSFPASWYSNVMRPGDRARVELAGER
ncbi:CDP-diacylglycerol pyrophosphatase [Xanthomonas sacchari]|uniref:CDP-diacylglycerol diphosphatase n=1 Tax=Xanthomonas sacchari TaxID=56458 RepID=UPI00278B465A|nr:CDP-diacylglycerol diphosphatase [Xanthomonas sacchari]MDQ1093587.1 CDP-diacylglycerol pyrophosphatase [Xanthomonas sacchari]